MNILSRSWYVRAGCVLVGTVMVGTWGCGGPDTRPPETVITASPPEVSDSPQATFNFDCNEDVCTFECRLDSGDWAFCSLTVSYYDLEDGDHIFEVRATDGSGNVEEPPVQHTWTVSLLWSKTYGGSGDDFAVSLEKSADGGYLVAGGTYSFGFGDGDAWVLKLRSDGRVAWEWSYGEMTEDGVSLVRERGGSGFLLAGMTIWDLWVVALDPDGSISWQNAYGGTGYDFARSIEVTSDGGYIVAGSTESFGAGIRNAWVLKLNPDGSVAWQKAYGDQGIEYCYAVRETGDGGYIAAGGTDSFGSGEFDIWLLRLDSAGTVLWQKAFGGEQMEYVYSVLETSGGHFLVVGVSESFPPGGRDAWLLELDSNGAVVWQKAYGGGYHDFAAAAIETNNGGYVVVGGTESFGSGAADMWMLRLDGGGAVLWEKAYGGIDDDVAWAVQPTDSGGYILAGVTGSFGAGGADVWVLKVDVMGEIEFDPLSGAAVTDSSAMVVNTSAAGVDTGVLEVVTSAEPVESGTVADWTDATVEQQAP